MKIIKPQTLGLMTRPFEFRREYWLGISVLAFLPVGDAPMLLKEAEMWPLLAAELPPDQPVDAVIPKTHPEFLAVAHCFAPSGVAAPFVQAGIQLGAQVKRLDVHGDRTFNRETARVGQATPFARMKLDWTRTYGGPGFADNPLGNGVPPDPRSGIWQFPVQNVVDPKLGEAGAQVPAGYGPVDQMWPARAKLAGTHDETWLKQDFPGFARDIDWRFFNVAPPDQWSPGPLIGDEAYAFQNLHPEHALLRGRLPGMAARLFLVRKNPTRGRSFEEVPLRLTTVWFFPHRERLVLVHHGQARLAEEDAADILRVVVGADRQEAPRAPEDFYAVMLRRTDTRTAAAEALRDEDLVPAEWLASAPDVPEEGAPEVEPAGPRLVLARVRKRAEHEVAAVGERLRARGMDPHKYLPLALPPPTPLPAQAELRGFADAAWAAAKAGKAKALADFEAKKPELRDKLANAGMGDDEIAERLTPNAKGPPIFSAAAVRASLSQQITAMRVLGQLTMGLEAQLASTELADQLDRAEAAARNGYRLGAHLQDSADPLPAERSAEIRGLIAEDSPAARAQYDLHGVDLSGLDLSGVDLSGACLDGANLSGTRLAGAKLCNAVLAHAAMYGCTLDGADLSGANLGKANLQHASLRNAVLKKSVLSGADLSHASLAGADLEGADCNDVLTDGTDFTDVRAPGLQATKLSLRGLHAPGIVLTRAKFIECDLQGANLVGANLEHAVFLKCNLAGADLEGARLRKSVFVQRCSLVGAHLSNADLTEANLRETILRGADLDGAILVRADLSKADLSNATLHFARGAGSQLIAADMRRADLSLSDFSGADMSRTDVRGADLRGMSVYEANVARAILDGETQRKGIFNTRVRFLPLYEPPKEAKA